MEDKIEYTIEYLPEPTGMVKVTARLFGFVGSAYLSHPSGYPDEAQFKASGDYENMRRAATVRLYETVRDTCARAKMVLAVAKSEAEACASRK